MHTDLFLIFQLFTGQLKLTKHHHYPLPAQDWRHRLLYPPRNAPYSYAQNVYSDINTFALLTESGEYFGYTVFNTVSTGKSLHP